MAGSRWTGCGTRFCQDALHNGLSTGRAPEDDPYSLTETERDRDPDNRWDPRAASLHRHLITRFNPISLLVFIAAGVFLISYLTDPLFWLVRRVTGDPIEVVVRHYTLPGLAMFMQRTGIPGEGKRRGRIPDRTACPEKQGGAGYQGLFLSTRTRPANPATRTAGRHTVGNSGMLGGGSELVENTSARAFPESVTNASPLLSKAISRG